MKTTPQDPVTYNDFLEEGSLAEESGDRWLGSDVSKALRFYQKSYDAYTKSLELNWSTENSDAFYNAARLLLQVYLLEKSSNGLVIRDLTDMGDIHGANSVVKSISEILDVHLKALEICGRNQDLLYNTATVYVEMLDDMIDSDYNVPLDELCSKYRSGEEILVELIPQQVNALESFVCDLASSNTESNVSFASGSSPPAMDQEQEEFESIEVTQPVDIFETVMLSYRLVQTTYENLSEGGEAVSVVAQTVAPFIDSLDQVASELILKYSEQSEFKNEMLENITASQVNELKIAKQSIISLQDNDGSRILESWERFFVSEVPDEIPEKYLTSVDNVQTVMERNDQTLYTINNSNRIDKEWYWRMLSQQNSLLKKAQGLTQDQLNAKRKLPSGVEQGIGSTIIQLCDIMIARADLSLQMASVKYYEPSVRNESALLQNCKTLLKSSMNIANSSGGLRERAIEKIDREKKLSESVFRLCLVDGKTSVSDLDEIMTRPRWMREYTQLKKVDVYEELLQRIPYQSVLSGYI
ncbi:hypothetical protein KGF57_000940 [Candida theae]|uniref:Uncharacterized protein n=1 Tax=Candida theae TaxID=1198502 RepID=A0AAD5G050_9ASCO|nr:uncharacterized protein KGF57_000940 [Candida theae]KAI5964448.1 hypothetical protein KGF57_000940 [Candida theae]